MSIVITRGSDTVKVAALTPVGVPGPAPTTDQIAPANGLIVSGNVGIGTASPACKLDVDGPIRCKSYTVATVPAASAGDAQMIYVTNPLVGSARPYWSRSGSWYDATGVLLA